MNGTPIGFLLRPLDLYKSQLVVSTLAKEPPALSPPHSKNPLSGIFAIARLKGADPSTSRVTGECSTVELQPQFLHHIILSLYVDDGVDGKICTCDLLFMSEML
jgi:hypothetical protein